MRIMSTFHALVVLMIVLTFGTSFATLAQQNPVLTEVSKTVAHRANAVALEAKAAAERDASKDTNEPLWFCLGTPLLFVFSYCFLGGHMMLNPSEYDDEGRAVVCAGLALSAFYVSRVSWEIFAEKTPPPERFIGRSPEYVESYLNAYKRKMRTLRGTSAVAGGGVACLSLFAFVFAFGQNL